MTTVSIKAFKRADRRRRNFLRSLAWRLDTKCAAKRMVKMIQADLDASS